MMEFIVTSFSCDNGNHRLVFGFCDPYQEISEKTLGGAGAIDGYFPLYNAFLDHGNDSVYQGIMERAVGYVLDVVTLSAIHADHRVSKFTTDYQFCAVSVCKFSR